MPVFARSTHEAPQPAKRVPSAGSNDGRAFANRRRPRELRVRGAKARAASWSRTGWAAVAVVGGRDAHPGERVGDAFGRAALLEAEAEPSRVGLRAAGPRHVHVELVRVLVVRDVEIGPAVAVDVGEHRAEPVAAAAPPRGPAWSPTSRKRACLRPSFR